MRRHDLSFWGLDQFNRFHLPNFGFASLVQQWVIVSGTITQAPPVPVPVDPTLIYTVVYGPAGTYQIKKGTVVVIEAYFEPPFDLQDYGDPGDTLSVSYLTAALPGPTVTLTATQAFSSAFSSAFG